jgi:hypothetical protein
MSCLLVNFLARQAPACQAKDLIRISTLVGKIADSQQPTGRAAIFIAEQPATGMAGQQAAGMAVNT